MDSQKKYIDRYSSQPGSKDDSASPFLDEELFSDAELAEVENLDSRLETFQLESPFLSIFEKPILDGFGESEIEEAEEFENYEVFDNEAANGDQVDYDDEFEEERENGQFLEESNQENTTDELSVPDEVTDGFEGLEEKAFNDYENILDKGEIDRYQAPDEYEAGYDEGFEEELENKQLLGKLDQEDIIDKPGFPEEITDEFEEPEEKSSHYHVDEFDDAEALEAYLLESEGDTKALGRLRPYYDMDRTETYPLFPITTLEILEHETPESERLFEQQRSRSSGRCPRFPKRFTLSSWKKRWRKLRGSRRNGFFERLRRKKIKLARLAHSEIRVPIEHVTWMLGELSENLTISLDDLATKIPEVNVTVELMRDLWGVSKDDLDLALQQHIWYRHGTTLSGCPIWTGVWGNVDEATYGKEFIESGLSINLDRMFRVTHVSSLSPAEKRLNLLVTYVSFPPEISQFVRYKAEIIDNQPRSFPEIPPDLKATRLASLRVDVPSKNVLWMLMWMKRIDAPLWVRRLTFDLKNFPHIAPRAEVRIDLFKFDIKDLKAVDFQFYPTGYLNDYIVKRIQQPRRPWVNTLFNMNYQSSLEKQFQINLQPLVDRATRDRDKTFFIVTVIFPVNESLLKSIVPDDLIHLGNFPFGKAMPTRKHRSEIKLVARHVADSWIRSISWQNFRPVTKITLIGFTDSVGSLDYNKRLSERRALRVETLLKQSIEKHWRSTDEASGSSLVRRIEFEIIPAGKAPAVADVGDNVRAGGWRGVEIKLDYAQPTQQQLKDILGEVKDLMDDSALVDRVFADPGFADVAKCVLDKLIDMADVDDRFVRGGSANHFIGGKLTSLHIENLRIVLLRKFFGKTVAMSKRQKLQVFRATLLLIKKGNQELQKHENGAATDDTIRALLDYTRFHLENDKHIYNCFEGTRLLDWF